MVNHLAGQLERSRYFSSHSHETMGATESRSRPAGYSPERDRAPSRNPAPTYESITYVPQPTYGGRGYFPNQQQQTRDESARQYQMPAVTIITQNAPLAQTRGSFQQQQPPNHRQSLNQSIHQVPQQKPEPTSRQEPQQVPKEKAKPKKRLVDVVESLKQVLEECGERDFTLERIDALYHKSRGESIPYSTFTFKSLSSMLESRCDFLTGVIGADGNTQWNLRPPSYQEAVDTHPLPTPNSETPGVKHSVYNLVHDEISSGDLNRLKQISETKARRGMTIRDFEIQYFAEFGTRIDFKGFSKVSFFNGLSDIIEVREERDVLKLFAVTQPLNTGNTHPRNVAKAPQAQNSYHGPQPSAGRGRGVPIPQYTKKTHPHGGPIPLPAKNTKLPEKHQGLQQPQRPHGTQTQQTQAQARSVGEKRNTAAKLALSPYFEKELRKIMQQCKSPKGVSPSEFKEYFIKNSAHEFYNHGLTDEEFFSALPHIFQMNITRDGIRLMPTPLTTGLARNNFSKWQSTSVLEGTKSPPNCNKASASTGNLAPPSGCTMHVLEGGRCLWIVSIQNYEYVPTGCVAKLANMTRDTVLRDLNKHSLMIQYIRRLEDPHIKQILVGNNVAKEDEVVQTIPLKSIPIILRAFLGKNVDEGFIKNLSDVSVEHVRNKMLNRPNRQ